MASKHPPWPGGSSTTVGLPPGHGDKVLQAFLNKTEALDTKKLASLVENPAKTIRKLAEKFPGKAVRRPTKRGEGYFIKVATR